MRFDEYYSLKEGLEDFNKMFGSFGSLNKDAKPELSIDPWWNGVNQWFLKKNPNNFETIASYKEGSLEVKVLVIPRRISQNESRKGVYTLYNYDFSNRPAMGSFFMDEYDNDIKQICNLTKKQYELLPFEKRAECNAKIQFKKYFNDRFYSLYMQTYNNSTYQKIYDIAMINKNLFRKNPTNYIAQHLYGVE